MKTIHTYINFVIDCIRCLIDEMVLKVIHNISPYIIVLIRKWAGIRVMIPFGR